MKQIRGIRRGPSDELLKKDNSQPVDGPANIKELSNDVNNVSLRREALNRLIEEDRQKIEREEAIIREAFGTAIGGTLNAEDGNKLRQRISQKRREILEASEKERYSLVSEIQEKADRIASFSSAYTSPSQLLKVQGLGTVERNQAAQAVEAMPLRDVVLAADEARRRNDLNLASAIVSRVERLDRQERANINFDLDAFSNAFVGEEYQKAQSYLTIARTEAEAATRVNGDLGRGNSRPLERIAAGLGAEPGKRVFGAGTGSKKVEPSSSKKTHRDPRNSIIVTNSGIGTPSPQ